MLMGFPAHLIYRVATRLEALGCEIYREGSLLNQVEGYMVFSGPERLIAKLALQFPAPIGVPSRIYITGKGKLGKRRGARVLVQAQA